MTTYAEAEQQFEEALQTEMELTRLRGDLRRFQPYDRASRPARGATTKRRQQRRAAEAARKRGR